MLSREAHGRGDVRSGGGLDHERGLSGSQAIPDLDRFVPARVLRSDHSAGDSILQVVHGLRRQQRGTAIERGDFERSSAHDNRACGGNVPMSALSSATKLCGCSIAGSSAALSITRNSHPKRALRIARDAQRRCSIFAAPDECRRHADARQCRRWYRRYPELFHQARHGREPSRCLRAIEVVRLECIPAIAEPILQERQVKRALAPEPIVRAFAGRGEKFMQCCCKFRLRLEHRQSECIDEHQGAQAHAAFGCEARCERAAQRLADHDRRREGRCTRSSRRSIPMPRRDWARPRRAPMRRDPAGRARSRDSSSSARG